MLSFIRRYLPAPERLAVLFLGIVIPLLIAGEIAEEVLAQERFAFEQPLMMWVHTHIGPAFTPLAVALHYIGSTPVAVVLSMLFAAWHYLRRHRSWAVFILLGTAHGGDVCGQAVFQSSAPRILAAHYPGNRRIVSQRPQHVCRRAGHGGGAGLLAIAAPRPDYRRRGRFCPADGFIAHCAGRALSYRCAGGLDHRHEHRAGAAYCDVSAAAARVMPPGLPSGKQAV